MYNSMHNLIYNSCRVGISTFTFCAPQYYNLRPEQRLETGLGLASIELSPLVAHTQ